MKKTEWQLLVDRSGEDLRHRRVAQGTLDDLSTQILSPKELKEIGAIYEPLYPMDYAVAFIAGAAGAISSFALTDSFNKVHGYSDTKNNGNLEW